MFNNKNNETDIFNLLDSIKKVQRDSDVLNNDLKYRQESNNFERLLKIGSSVISEDEKTNKTPTDKLKEYISESTKKTMSVAKNLFTDKVKRFFVIDDQNCGTTTPITFGEVRLRPEQFDYFDLLRISPDSSVGVLLYENEENYNGIKFNKELFNLFLADPLQPPFEFKNKKDETIFKIRWDDITQEYVITELDFHIKTPLQLIEDYYSSIEYPDINDVLKQAILYTLHGDGTETKLFNINSEIIFKLLNKVFSVCNNNVTNNEPLNQTPIGVFDEDDDVIINMFDFNELENEIINTDRLRNIITFTNCENFEITTNPRNLKDLSYFISKNTQPINLIINNSLKKISNEYYIKSGQQFPKHNFEVFILNQFNENLLRSIFSTILTPKLLFPLVILQNSLGQLVDNVKLLIQKLFRLIYDLFKSLFWFFLKTLWSYIRKDLLIFIKKYAAYIFNEKVLRYKLIIRTLISLFKKITQIDSCDDLYKTILDNINRILNVRVRIPVSGLLLVLAETLPGFSKDKAYINIITQLNKNGITTDDLYGRENKLKFLAKATIDGIFREIDENSYIKVSNREICIPSPAGVICFPPGIINSNGKLF